MEWVTALRGTIVAFDTAPLIYLIEENPTYLPFVRAFFEALDKGEFRAVTSTVTMAEVLVHPMRNGSYELADQYRRILLHAHYVVTMPVTEAIAEQAARLRANHNLRMPDAIQLGTAIDAGASTFFTNDSRLRSLPFPEIMVLNQLVSKK